MYNNIMNLMNSLEERYYKDIKLPPYYYIILVFHFYNMVLKF